MTMTYFRLAGIAMALVTTGCEERPSVTAAAPTSGKTVQLGGEAERTAQIRTVVAGPATLTPRLVYQGDVRLALESRAKVSARVAGIVRSATPGRGDLVRRGAVLAVVESRELGEAAVSYLEARQRLEAARAARDREKELWHRRISSKEEYLRREHGLEHARLARKTAVSRLLVLGLTAGEVRALDRRGAAQIARHRVRAPIAGTVTRRAAVRGQAVIAGTELFEVADLSRLTISFAVRAQDLASLARGKAVELHNRKLGLTAKGTLEVVPPVIDPATRTGVAVAVFPNLEARWRPGLCADVTVTGRPVEAPVSVPVDAVVELDGRPAVFVRTAGGFKPRQVELGTRDHRRAALLSGVSGGEAVAASNVLVLKSAWQQGE
jgi:cobalt-zinc-cadmium efflux system membrane fusion protein